MPSKTDRILGYLPHSFLPDRRRSAVTAVAGAAGEELQRGEVAMARVLRSHWVDTADEGAALIDDLQRIGSMYGLAPLRDVDDSQLETVEQFRVHLKRHVRSLLEGRVTVRGLLEVAAEILGVNIAQGSDVDVWWSRSSEWLVTQVPRGEDAAPLLFGLAAADVRGADARPAMVRGTVDLSGGADLSNGSFLKLQVDDGGSFLIDLADGQQDVRTVPLDDIVGAINAPFAFPVASHDGRYLTLRSKNTGSDGRLELEEVEGDAALAILGVPALMYIGADPRTATARSNVDLSGGVDLQRERYLRLVIDGKLRAEIDCADAAGPLTLLDHIRDRINQGLNAEVASHDGRTLTVQSPTSGSGGSVFVQEPAAQSAAPRILGTATQFFLGADARQASATSTRDLSTPVDLSERSLIKVRLDASPAITIDCAGLEPSKTTVEEIVNILNAMLGVGRATTDGRRLTLTSRTAGRTGQIVFERADTGDALADIFGFGPRVFTGDAAVPASLTGTADLSGGVDLTASDRFGLIVDDGPLREVRLPRPTAAEMLAQIEANEAPEHVRRTSLDDVVKAIDEAVGQDVAFTNGRQIILTSTIKGAASRLAVVPLERETRRRFVSRAAVVDEAATLLLGSTDLQAFGKAPTRAQVTGTVDLQFGVDLREDRWLNLAIDSSPPVAIDCAGPRPRTTTIDEIEQRIAAVVGTERVSQNGKRLTIRSTASGASSRIRFAPVRTRDAMDLLLGVPPQDARGKDAGRVVFIGTVDLSRGVDLAPDARLKIGIDEGAPVEFALNHGTATARKSLGDIVSAINAAVGPTVASHDGRFVVLTSGARGAASTLQFEVPSGTDATPIVFGIAAPRAYQADEATAATISGQRQLPDVVDVRLARFLRIAVDGRPAKLVDCGARADADDELAALPLEKIRGAINQALNGTATLVDNRLVLHSPTRGSASRIALEPHVGGDARARILGDVPSDTRGEDATPAEIVGAVRLLSPVDLTARTQMLIALDGSRPIEVDVAGPAGRQVTLNDVVDAINSALPGVASATIDAQLRLQSRSAGEASSVAVLPRRYFELVEYPTAPAEQIINEPVGHGQTISVQNKGVSESAVTVTITSVHGTVGPALVNHASGKEIALDVVLRPHESAVLEPDLSGSRVRVVRQSPYERPVVLGAYDVRVTQLGQGSADAPLELPRGVTHWTFLECLGPRFDSSRFDEERFPDGVRRTVGMFNIGRLDGELEENQSVFAPVPLPPPSARLRFDWLSHQGGGFVLNLPAELTPTFGGRFNDARFGIGVDASSGKSKPKIEVREGIVFEPPTDDDYILKRFSGFELFEVSDRSFVVPLGFVANHVPFRQPRFFTLGSATEPARMYLVEDASGAVIELKASAPGAWGNRISVSVRPDGPGRYQFEIGFAGDRFESARAAVAGAAEDAKTETPTTTQPVPAPGILRAKAAGVSARVTRDRAREGPTID